ncbi:SprB repeat-containing protein [Chitinophagales bacterium]|nr:SprB repeat-containing protein [Chitinophagales bacterium]
MQYGTFFATVSVDRITMRLRKINTKRATSSWLTGCMWLLLCSLVPIALLAQDPCEEAGYVVSTSANAVECAGTATGNATVASTGCNCMFSGCTYTWSDGQSNHTAVDLVPGTYSVIVTHPNGCVLETEVVVAEAESIVELEEVVQVSCAGENNASIELVPADFQQLDYLWNTGETGASLENLAAGNYSVVATNFAGCFYAKEFIIEEPEEIILAIELSPTCGEASDGKAKITATGGVEPYSYWLNGQELSTNEIENLSAGDYSLQVLDSKDCMEFVQLQMPDLEDYMIVDADRTEACYGEQIQLVAPFVDGASYKWYPEEGLSDPAIHNPIATMSKAIAYELTVETATSCVCITDFSLNLETGPDLSIAGGTLEICQGELTSVSVFAGAGANSYSWFPTNGVSNPSSNAVVLNPEETTTYEVIVTYGSDCASRAVVTVEVNDCSTVSGLEEDSTFELIHQDDQLQIETAVNLTGSLFAMNGQQIAGQKISQGRSTWSLIDQAPGLYLVVLQDVEGTSKTQRIFIQ